MAIILAKKLRHSGKTAARGGLSNVADGHRRVQRVPAVTGLRRIVADAVLLRLHAETAIWNLDSTSAGAAMVLERASMQLDELMRGVAIRLHILHGTTNWSSTRCARSHGSPARRCAVCAGPASSSACARTAAR